MLVLYSVEFPDGGRTSVDLDWTYEFLTEPFEIARDVVLGPGAYEFSQVTAGYNSDRSRWLSGSAGSHRAISGPAKSPAPSPRAACA